MTGQGWRRRDPAPKETAAAVGAAALVGAGVATATFWLVRTLLARERVMLRPPTPPPALPPAPERRRLP